LLQSVCACLLVLRGHAFHLMLQLLLPRAQLLLQLLRRLKLLPQRCNLGLGSRGCSRHSSLLVLPGGIKLLLQPGDGSLAGGSGLHSRLLLLLHHLEQSGARIHTGANTQGSNGLCMAR
jgi:hypothetical protein